MAHFPFGNLEIHLPGNIISSSSPEIEGTDRVRISETDNGVTVAVSEFGGRVNILVTDVPSKRTRAVQNIGPNIHIPVPRHKHLDFLNPVVSTSVRLTQTD